MKILYISTVFPRPQQSDTIYTDLATALKEKGHEIQVVATDSSGIAGKTGFDIERGIKVLRVKTGKMYNVNPIRKGLTVLTLKHYMTSSIRKHLKNENYDFILFETPPVTLADVVHKAMKQFNCPSYLMLKDIFPQNAADLGMMKKSSPIFVMFRNKERKLYRISSMIGCMSEANRNYLINHNDWLNPSKVEVFTNTKKIGNVPNRNKQMTEREKLGIPTDSILLLYGGNMGKPQGLEFLMDIIKAKKEDKRIYFAMVGRGTERQTISEFIKNENIENAALLGEMPRDEYERLVTESDIGLIFLSKRFTIPNFPSRILSYFEYTLPVLAATDSNTDFGDMIEKADAGYWCESGDIEGFIRNIDRLASDKVLMQQMGRNGRKYLEENFTVDRSVKLLENYYEKINKKRG